MKDLAFINTSTLVDICDSIRKKECSTDVIDTTDISERIDNLPDVGFRPGMFDIDRNNKTWVKPEEWDDIESIDITNKNECYLLCGCKLMKDAFVNLQVTGGSNIYWSWGHVVNGEFIISPNSLRTKISSGGIITLALFNLNEDYIVIKIEADNYLQSVKTYALSASGTPDIPYALPANYNCVLMRYGRFANGTPNLEFKSVFFVSDRIIDFAKEKWNSAQNITFVNAYSGNTAQQRLVLDNFHPEKLKVTSYSGMLSTCYALCELKGFEDMSGWVTSACTTVESMFNACFSLNMKLIVKNWDVSNITSFKQWVKDARNITEIIGLETWTRASNCKAIDNMFSYCYNLRGTIDLSALYLGRGNVDLVCSGTDLFRCTKSIDKIILNNCDFSKLTAMGSMFNESNCRELVWDTNFTGSGPTCTSVGSMFCKCEGFKEIVIDGWDLSGCTGANALGNIFNYSYGIKKIIFKNCIAPSKITDTSSSAGTFAYAQLAEYIDFSFIDMSACTNVYMHQSLFSNCPKLVELYPPKNICKAFIINNSTGLSHDSLLRILNNLSTVTGSPKLTIGSYNISRLNEEEKAIATGKGWTLA